MTDIEIKPTTFARGVPKAQHNGFFGVEEKLLGMPIGTQITVVSVYELKDDITKRGDGSRYPVVSIEHLEPIWDEDEAAKAREAQAAAYKERTGSDQLDLDFSGDDEAEGDEEGEGA